MKDYSSFNTLYGDLEQTFAGESDCMCDKNESYGIGIANVGNYIVAENIFTFCVAIAKDLAEAIHKVLEPERELITPPEMLMRPEGKIFGMQD